MNAVGASLKMPFAVAGRRVAGTPEDAIRSLKVYAWQALGEEWEVRLWDEEGQLRYPFARVERAGPAATSGPAAYVDYTLPATVHCYPEPCETREEAKMAAYRVEQLLHDAIRILGVGDGAPLRVPLYDFKDVPLDVESWARAPHDYMRVLDFQTQHLHDPASAGRIAVMADVRLGWRRTGRVPFGKPVTSVRLTIGSS